MPDKEEVLEMDSKWSPDDMTRFSTFFPDDDKKKQAGDSDEAKSVNDRYYVYALCDDGVPFYIGKGTGGRCFQHQESLADLLKEYQKEMEAMDEEERALFTEKLNNALSDKHKRIQESIQKETFDIAIVKFGLTEHEAFMCESDTINTLRLLDVELTNAVNGHGSRMEKETGERVKARFMDDFLAECCPPSTSLAELYDFLNAPDFPFDPKKDDVVFISYNRFYPYCETVDDHWDSVRGCWTLGKEKAERCKYVFAMHNNIIKHIFKVRADGETRTDFQKLVDVTSPLKPIEGDVISRIEGRKGDIDLAERLLTLYEKEPELRDIKGEKKKKEAIVAKLKAAYPDMKDLEPKKLNRGFFACDWRDYEEDPDLQAIRERFQNCQVVKEDLIIPEGSYTTLLHNTRMNDPVKAHIKASRKD
ncbi:MAG: GIY-YIG nuclease family protein [Oscillospiraceae bacterium]|nr:GIY-YIG nuclease family protein [Oscillospiraceae bacterium]